MDIRIAEIKSSALRWIQRSLIVPRAQLVSTLTLIASGQLPADSDLSRQT